MILYNYYYFFRHVEKQSPKVKLDLLLDDEVLKVSTSTVCNEHTHTVRLSLSGVH